VLQRGLLVIDFKQEMRILKLQLRIHRRNLTPIIKNLFYNRLRPQHFICFL
jgi:hypothetical protein